MTSTEFQQKIQDLDAMYPLSITGGKRSRKRNEEVGGSPNSRHLKWTAVDVVLDDMSDGRRLDFVIECRRQSLVAVDERDHIHVQD